MSDDGFKYEIKKHIGILSKYGTIGYPIEVNLISYRGTTPKIDIRRWNRETSRMTGKGIALSEDEARALMSMLQKEFKERDAV